MAFTLPLAAFAHWVLLRILYDALRRTPMYDRDEVESYKMQLIRSGHIHIFSWCLLFSLVVGFVVVGNAITSESATLISFLNNTLVTSVSMFYGFRQN